MSVLTLDEPKVVEIMSRKQSLSFKTHAGHQKWIFNIVCLEFWFEFYIIPSVKLVLLQCVHNGVEKKSKNF